MGAIQGSINSMLGSVAVAAAGAKHIKEQKAANEIAKAGMAEKKAGVDEELLKLEGEQETQEKELELISTGRTPEGEIRLDVDEEVITKDIESRKKALQVLKEKITAKRLLQGAYQRALGGKE